MFKFWNDVTFEKAFNFVEMLRRNIENCSDRAYSCYAKHKPELPRLFFLGMRKAAQILPNRTKIKNISVTIGVDAVNIECIVRIFRIALVFHFLNLMLGNQIKDFSRLIG